MSLPSIPDAPKFPYTSDWARVIPTPKAFFSEILTNSFQLLVQVDIYVIGESYPN
jgi:hypothetical protein